MVRIFLFDIDGTLVRTGGAGVKAFRRVFETEFNAVDGFEKLKFAGRTDLSLIREFFSAHGIPPSRENIERFLDRYVFMLDHILEDTGVQVCPGVERLISALRAFPQPPVIGLLTGNIRLGAELKLRKAGIWDWFETGAFADDHEERDHIAAIAHQRGEMLLGEKARGEHVVVVGDTPLDIRCAKAIGARCLAVATGGASLAELQEHKPAWVVPDLTHIAAEAIVSGSPVLARL